MKTRTSFVANSSSSSFIIAFEKKPKSVAELAKLMFPKEDLNDSAGYDEYYNESNEIRIIDVVEQVFKDLKGQKSRTDKQILDEIQHGWFEGYPEMNWHDEESETLIKEFEKKHGKRYYDVAHSEDKRYAKDIATINACRWKKVEEQRREVNEAAERLWKNKKPGFKDKKVFVFSYSDNVGDFEAFMEHGDIFTNLTHITVSHH